MDYKPKIGLALGSGSARGWAHIGVIQALAGEGIVPDLVCGCSIGAFVGAVHASGNLDKLADWVSGLTWQNVLALLDVSFKSGLIKGDKLFHFVARHFLHREFTGLNMPFACVATNLQTGHEVWLREGSLLRAVRASAAMPGLMTPVRSEAALLVDGALVNPVPVSLCRAMGAEIVIAVDLGSDIVGRARGRTAAVKEPPPQPAEESGWTARLLGRLRNPGEAAEESLPSLVSVIQTSINVMQVRIARSRLAGDPADVLLAPRLAQLGLMDYHRGMEAIAEGMETVKRMRPAIDVALGR